MAAPRSSQPPTGAQIAWVAGVIVAAALALFTGHKLYTMARIRGFVGSRNVERHQLGRVEQELRMTRWGAESPRGSRYCFLQWQEDELWERAQSDCTYADRLHAGDPIEIVRLDGDREPYVIGGEIYASDGNFRLDRLFLGGELLALAVCITGASLARKRVAPVD
jgi:hypothetical protein